MLARPLLRTPQRALSSAALVRRDASDKAFPASVIAANATLNVSLNHLADNPGANRKVAHNDSCAV